QADATRVHVLHLGEVEHHGRRAFVDRLGEARHELGFAAGRDVAGDAQDRDRADAVEADHGRGHAASPSTMSMKSDRRVIPKVSRAFWGETTARTARPV